MPRWRRSGRRAHGPPCAERSGRVRVLSQSCLYGAGCLRKGAWARHDSRFTRAFEDQVCWLAVNASKTAVAELMRVAWRTVGAILERVAAEATREVDLLDGLRRIGIDEISHRKGQRYLTVVVDHHSGRLVWAAPGRDRKTGACVLRSAGRRALQTDRIDLRRHGVAGSPGRSPNGYPTRSDAWTRSMS